MKAVSRTERPDVADDFELTHEVCTACGKPLPEPVTTHWRMDVFCAECGAPDED